MEEWKDPEIVVSGAISGLKRWAAAVASAAHGIPPRTDAFDKQRKQASCSKKNARWRKANRAARKARKANRFAHGKRSAIDKEREAWSQYRSVNSAGYVLRQRTYRLEELTVHETVFPVAFNTSGATGTGRIA